MIPKRDTKTFNVVSLDGKIEKVKIIPDYVNRVLRMTCLQDTIAISDFWGVPPEIHILNRSFIEIRYEVRGGSNLGLGNTLILCVNDGKLYEAMHVLRYMNWDSGNQKENYHITLILNGEDRLNYRLIVHIHDNVYSKLEPETNYNYNNQTVLSFDTRRNVFYSIKETVSCHVATTKTGKTVKQKIVGDFPVIILGKQTYYFIKGRWYQSRSTNEMDEI
ncbi:MAG: hypothetical protein ACHQIM_20060 [Sphingobacteriales bacterium]